LLGQQAVRKILSYFGKRHIGFVQKPSF